MPKNTKQAATKTMAVHHHHHPTTIRNGSETKQLGKIPDHKLCSVLKCRITERTALQVATRERWRKLRMPSKVTKALYRAYNMCVCVCVRVCFAILLQPKNGAGNVSHLCHRIITCIFSSCIFRDYDELLSTDSIQSIPIGAICMRTTRHNEIYCEYIFGKNEKPRSSGRRKHRQNCYV